MGGLLSSRQEYVHPVEVNYPPGEIKPVRGWENIKDDEEEDRYSTRYADVEFDLENDFTHKAFLIKIAKAVGYDSFNDFKVELRYIHPPYDDPKNLRVITDTVPLRNLIMNTKIKFVVDVRRAPPYGV